MTELSKNEYIRRLKTALYGLSKEEIDSAVSYYEEFIDEAGEENLDAVIASLGSPEELGKSIKAENSFVTEQVEEENAFGENSYTQQTTFNPPLTEKQQARKRTNGEIAAIIIITLLALPIIIGALGGVLGTVFGIIVTVFVLMFVFVVVGISLIIAGIIKIITDLALGMLLLGIGLIAAGIGFLVFVPLVKLILKGVVWLFKKVFELFNKLIGKAGVNA